MDPRDSFTRPPPDPWSAPPPSTAPWQWIFDKHYELAQNVAALLANQQTNKADILEHLRLHRDHHDQRFDDFRDEVIPRLVRLEARPSKPEPESSLARSLFGSIGVFLLGVIPWKHVWLMAPGIILAAASNLAPEGTRRFILAAVDLFWKTSPP